MAKHMMILNRPNEELVEQLLKEDLPTFIENSIDLIDNGEDTTSISKYAELLIDQLRDVDMSDVNSFFVKIMTHMSSGLTDQAKVDLVLLKNFIGDIEIIYN